MSYLKAAALSGVGRAQEAAAFCREWMQEWRSILAVAASVYALLDADELEEAEALIKKYIDKDTECTNELETLFIAASEYYERTGNLEEQKRMEDAMNAHDNGQGKTVYHIGDAPINLADWLPPLKKSEPPGSEC